MCSSDQNFGTVCSGRTDQKCSSLVRILCWEKRRTHQTNSEVWRRVYKRGLSWNRSAELQKSCRFFSAVAALEQSTGVKLLESVMVPWIKELLFVGFIAGRIDLRHSWSGVEPHPWSNHYNGSISFWVLFLAVVPPHTPREVLLLIWLSGSPLYSWLLSVVLFPFS